MRRPDLGMAPLSQSSSVVPAASVLSTSRGRFLRSSSSRSLLSPPAGSGGWTLPPLNQFMTLPRTFLATPFRPSMDNIYTGSSRNDSRMVLGHRTVNSTPSVNVSALDTLLNDEDEEWNAPDHFVLPHMVHRTAGSSTDSTSRQQEEIDLTVSSSEDEGDDLNAIGDTDDVIEIIETVGASEPTSLHRKRRRARAGAGEHALVGPKRQCSMAMMRSAESTNVGMRNNEMLQKFKSELKCTICLDVLEGITSTICGHIFCAGCIRQAIRANGKCPLCQRRLHLKDIHPLFF